MGDRRLPESWYNTCPDGRSGAWNKPEPGGYRMIQANPSGSLTYGWNPPDGGPYVAILGSFDGFHRGHRRLVETAQDAARRERAGTLLLTFEPHPGFVVGHPVELIQSPRQRREWLAHAPVDAVWVVPFTPAMADLEPEQFLEMFFLPRLPLRTLVVGEDFRFGRARRGDVVMLRAYGPAFGFEVEAVPAYTINDRPCRSSQVRRYVREGRVREAAQLLGRPFSLWGFVHPGERYGRRLGFPTANLWWRNLLAPRSGVYLTVARTPDAVKTGVTNVGVRPTMNGTRLLVETHFPGEDLDLYGAAIELFFLEKIRDERPFDSPAALRRQIARDVRTAQTLFDSRYAGVDWNERLRPWAEPMEILQTTDSSPEISR